MTTPETAIKEEHFRSYQQIKQKFPDAVVLLRIGDDYITFRQDTAVLLQLENNNMTCYPDTYNAGLFPFAEMDGILHELVRAGNRVAICDQL